MHCRKRSASDDGKQHTSLPPNVAKCLRPQSNDACRTSGGGVRGSGDGDDGDGGDGDDDGDGDEGTTPTTTKQRRRWRRQRRRRTHTHAHTHKHAHNTRTRRNTQHAKAHTRTHTQNMTPSEVAAALHGHTKHKPASHWTKQMLNGLMETSTTADTGSTKKTP